MVDWWLIVIAVIVPVILVGINLIILARYLDPEDRRGHLLSKIFIVRCLGHSTAKLPLIFHSLSVIRIAHS